MAFNRIGSVGLGEISRSNNPEIKIPDRKAIKNQINGNPFIKISIFFGY